jgi:phage shock protein A
MKLFHRMALLFRADAHGVLDQLEERSLLLKQHLREAELELARKRARAEALDEEGRRLEEDVRKLEDEVGSLDEDVELALAGGKEELARFSVRRLLPRRQALAALRTRMDEIAEARRRLGERLAAQEQQFSELERRVRASLAAERAREPALFGASEPAIADEEVELELLRRRGVPGGRADEEEEK